MGTLMTEEEFSRMMPYAFIFDLEYIGTPNELKECYIWEIGAIHYMSGEEFTITIDPGIRPLRPLLIQTRFHRCESLRRAFNNEFVGAAPFYGVSHG